MSGEYQFPYTNIGDLNLDWILEEMKTLKADIVDLQERVTVLEEGD